LSAPTLPGTPPCERAGTILAAILLDLALGEPPNRCHPVAWLGQAVAWAERRAPRRDRAARLAFGGALTSLAVGGSGLVGLGLSCALAPRSIAIRLTASALALKLSLSLRDLVGSARRTGRQLERGDLDAARLGLRALVSRPSDGLTPAQVASAAIESVAENLSDSLIAPIFYYVLWGLPGAFAYRAANTLDAMIGYHGEYEELGRAAARLDDLMNFIPARLAALLIGAAAGLGFGNGRGATATLRRDCARTESPNAGWPMSTMAGALRVGLDKPGSYRLGEGFREPEAGDIRRAVQLCLAAAALGIGLATLVALARSPRRACPAGVGAA